MATFLRRASGRWQAKVRRQNKALSRTFPTRAEAETWALTIEGKIVADEYEDRKRERETTVRDLLDRYEKEVTPSKKGAKQEGYRLAYWRRQKFADWPATSLKAEDLADWRDEYAAAGRAPSSVNNKLNLLSAVYKKASEWGLSLQNPVRGVQRVRGRTPREATLSPDEEKRLLAASRKGPPWLEPVARIALETAMRQGEIRALRWEHVHGTHVHVPKSKNGTKRDVPLTYAGESLFKQLRKSLPSRGDGFIFGDPALPAAKGGITKDMISQAFRDATAKAKLSITFHDLRHVAITRLAPLHRDAVHLSRTTGHKGTAMLLRYYNPDPRELSRELRMRQREHVEKLREEKARIEAEIAAAEKSERRDRQQRISMDRFKKIDRGNGTSSSRRERQ